VCVWAVPVRLPSSSCCQPPALSHAHNSYRTAPETEFQLSSTAAAIVDCAVSVGATRGCGEPGTVTNFWSDHALAVPSAATARTV